MNNPLLAKLRSLITLIGLLLGVMEAARADIIIIKGPGGGNPDENIQYNQAGLITGASFDTTTVQGATNQTNRTLDISSTVDLLALHGSGQAAIWAKDGNPFGSGGVMFTPHVDSLDLPTGLHPLGGFTDFKFNIDAVHGGPVTIIAFDDMGLSETLMSTLDEHGQNFFRLTATNGMSISKVTVHAESDIVGKFKQLRIGGLLDPSGGGIDPPDQPDPPETPTPVPVTTTPEPSSMVIWAFLGFLTVVLARSFRATRPGCVATNQG